MARFKDICEQYLKGEVRPWMSVVPADTSVTVKDFPVGHVIRSSGDVDRSSEGRSISILLTETAELFEEYFLPDPGFENSSTGVRAYRPVRLIEKGDIFGDFSAIDRDAFGEEKFIQTLSRPFENWSIAYGPRVGIIIPADGLTGAQRDSVLGALYSAEFHTLEYSKPSAEHFGSHNLLTRGRRERVKVAELPLYALDEDNRNRVLNALVRETSWRRAYTYRTGQNSYNIGESFRFSFGAKLATHFHFRESRNETGRVYNNRVYYDDIIDIFIDAVYDAINRPVREEPVFGFEAAEGNRDLYRILRPMRISKKPSLSEFYFPIGITNFLVMNYAQTHDKIKRISKGLSHIESRKAAQTIGDGTVFWKSVAEKIVEFHERLPQSVDELDLGGMAFDQGANSASYKNLLKKSWNERLSKVLINYDYSLSIIDMPDLYGGKELYLKYSRKLRR